MEKVRNITFYRSYFRDFEYLTTFEEHLEERYGPVGSEKRTEFENNAKAFAMVEIINEERRLSRLTNQQ